MPCAVISSTVHDLPLHRAAARDACLRQDFFPMMMEHQAPSPANPTQLSRELVDQADVYVLILGFRYGEVAAGQDKSFTHLEIDRANERGIPKLVLLMADNHTLTKADVDTGLGAERVHQLREQVRHEQAVNFFSSPEQLRALLIDGLSDMRKRLRPRQVPFHHIRQLVTPPAPYIAHPYTLLQVSGVIGRQRELNVLTDWVTGSATRLNMARILIFVAIGGIGKSAVTWKWFNEVAPHEMRPLAGRVWWSFYESDAHFDNFVSRALAYVSGLTLEQVQEKRLSEQVDDLLTVLDQEPYLIVLDGLERLLIAYARLDAAHLADDDLDARTARIPGRTPMLPASEAVNFTDESRLRMTADPRVGDFLQRLATVRASRVLSTSRLYPIDLQTVTGEPVPGSAAYFVKGLSDDDAVNLWRAFEVTGSSRDLVTLFNTFDNHPLLIRALVGEVARFRAAPGDFDTWRKAHPGFDPFRLPLVQRKSHIMQYALNGLTETDNHVLRIIAAFRAPATYDTLAALLVGSGKPCSDEAALDVVLSDLEDRGLLGWDRRGNRYDLHPVVRGVAWSAIDAPLKQDIYQDLASYFEALPSVSEDSVKSIEDLTGAIELYKTLIQLGRVQEAFNIFHRISGPMTERLWTFRELAELLELMVERPEIPEIAGDSRKAAALYAMLTGLLGMLYYFGGDIAYAISALNKIGETVPAEDFEGMYADYLTIRSIILCQAGALAEAEWSARMSIIETQKATPTDYSEYVYPLAALVIVLIRRGEYEESNAWLSDYRLQMGLLRDRVNVAAGDEPFQVALLSEGAIAALRQGDIASAQVFAERMAAIAENSALPQAKVQAMAVSGDIAQAQGKRDQTHDLLNNALVLARVARLPDSEAGLLVQLGHWNALGGRLDAARAFANDALNLARHAQLRLREVDALNLLSNVEYTCGNQPEAANAAAEAYRLAWCDGPPFAYEWGLRKARESLMATGQPQPINLPTFNAARRMPELGIVPTSQTTLFELQPSTLDSYCFLAVGTVRVGHSGLTALARTVPPAYSIAIPARHSPPTATAGPAMTLPKSCNAAARHSPRWLRQAAVQPVNHCVCTSSTLPGLADDPGPIGRYPDPGRAAIGFLALSRELGDGVEEATRSADLSWARSGNMIRYSLTGRARSAPEFGEGEPVVVRAVAADEPPAAFQLLNLRAMCRVSPTSGLLRQTSCRTRSCRGMLASSLDTDKLGRRKSGTDNRLSRLGGDATATLDRSSDGSVACRATLR
jgi:hypothetical protein